jgi:putative Mg2+ transporter-C (MgtC) family protein
LNPHLPIWIALFRLSCALFCGVLIGAEREWRQRLAGVRTFALVSVGAALFVMLAPLIGEAAETSRISAQIASGVGFLGAGVLIRTGIGVRGLNTASSIWCSAALETLAGAGCYFTAFVGAIFVLVITVALRPLTSWIHKHSTASTGPVAHYHVMITCRQRQEGRVRGRLIELIQESQFGLHELASAANEEAKRTVITAQISAPERFDSQLEQVVGHLGADPDVTTVSWSVGQAKATE